MDDSANLLYSKYSDYFNLADAILVAPNRQIFLFAVSCLGSSGLNNIFGYRAIFYLMQSPILFFLSSASISICGMSAIPMP